MALFEAPSEWDLPPPVRAELLKGGLLTLAPSAVGVAHPSKPNRKKRMKLRERAVAKDLGLPVAPRPSAVDMRQHGGEKRAAGEKRTPVARHSADEQASVGDPSVDRKRRRGSQAALETAPSAPAQPAPSALHSKLLGKLHGARFRQLNEQLYTTDSAQAQALLRKEPELFAAYHQGFREQVRRWPVNPLDQLILWAKRLPPSLVIGDFGCGEAALSASVPQQVHSFDLVAPNERVVACDIAHVPLAAGSLDVAVFCLALMGTNWADFLREAHRTLRPGGVLKVVEVRSRVTDLSDFMRTLRALGFDRKGVDESNSHFITIEAAKAARAPEPFNPKPLAPCLYKRR